MLECFYMLQRGYCKQAQMMTHISIVMYDPSPRERPRFQTFRLLVSSAAAEKYTFWVVE